jgi:uncharacterized protein YbaR (Trm112 family)
MRKETIRLFDALPTMIKKIGLASDIIVWDHEEKNSGFGEFISHNFAALGYMLDEVCEELKSHYTAIDNGTPMMIEDDLEQPETAEKAISD